MASRFWLKWLPQKGTVPFFSTNKILLGVLSGVIFLWAILAVAPVIWTRCVYVDVINGDKKYITTLFGFTYRNKVYKTSYSVLVDRLGLREPSDWKLAVKDERDIRKMGILSHIGYNASKTMAIMDSFVLLATLNGIEDPTKEILKLRMLFEQDGANAGQKYVDAMWERWNIVENQGIGH